MSVLTDVPVPAPSSAGLSLVGTARRLADSSPGAVDDPRWVAAARRAWEDTPAWLRRRLREFRRDSGPHGATVVGGLPLGGEPPATPSADGSIQREATVPAATLMMIACGLGDPVAFRPEKSGALVQNVVPVPGREQMQGNSGSVQLSFHNENAFHAHRPDLVMLLCLRADHEKVARLHTSCIRKALPDLSAGARQVLAEPRFVTAAPPSFGETAGAPEPHPVLHGAADDPDLRVDFAATEPTDAASAAALEELHEALVTNADSHRLGPGDLAIVDNRVTVHGRSSFRPRYDGRDRWLQRTFVLCDLRRSRAGRSGDGNVLD